MLTGNLGSYSQRVPTASAGVRLADESPAGTTDIAAVAGRRGKFLGWEMWWQILPGWFVSNISQKNPLATSATSRPATATSAPCESL